MTIHPTRHKIRACQRPPPCPKHCACREICTSNQKPYSDPLHCTCHENSTLDIRKCAQHHFEDLEVNECTVNSSELAAGGCESLRPNGLHTYTIRTPHTAPLGHVWPLKKSCSAVPALTVAGTRSFSQLRRSVAASQHSFADPVVSILDLPIPCKRFSVAPQKEPTRSPSHRLAPFTSSLYLSLGLTNHARESRPAWNLSLFTSVGFFWGSRPPQVSKKVHLTPAFAFGAHQPRKGLTSKELKLFMALRDLLNVREFRRPFATAM